MKVEQIYSENAPPAIGPYAQAVRLGNVIFTSGQIPLDLDGNVVEGGIREQTAQVLKNLKAVLAAADAQMSDVVKTTIFLKNMGDFAEVNTLYAETFGKHKPARSTIEVSRLPKDVLIEIEMIASTHA